jgi:hypothetical protein
LDINSYYHILANIFEAAAENDKQVQQTNFIAQKRQEEALMSSSGSIKGSHECNKECKYTELRKKFSATILSKLEEYGLDASNMTPAEARKRLLALGMPLEYARLPLQQDGKDVSAVENLLAKHGLSSQVNLAVIQGIENRSMSSAIAFAEGLIEKSEPKSLKVA